MRIRRCGFNAVMVTQLVLLLPVMIAFLALVIDCANFARCKSIASSAASEGARYAAANPEKNDGEVEDYLRGAVGLDSSCGVEIDRSPVASKEVTLRVGDKTRDSSINRNAVTVKVDIPCRRVFTLAVFTGADNVATETSTSTAISSEVR